MSRPSIRSRASQQLAEMHSPEVNLSPLIDVVFLLLIFFVVTTVFVEETGLEITRPVASTAKDLEKQSVLVGISPDGAVALGGQVFPRQRVRGWVAAQLRGRDWPVVVVADESVPTGVLVEVMDECRKAGAQSVHVSAVAP